MDKAPVLAQDTPGFIVNRVARPFYGEAIRLLEEGIADAATIDWALTELGGFRMGPFALMDFIGHDVNFRVTEAVYAGFFYDSRYRPSLTQQRLLAAGYLGRKAGRGFYDYAPGAVPPTPCVMLSWGCASCTASWPCSLTKRPTRYIARGLREDLELAMTTGVNYPKGLLAWADELGPAHGAGHPRRPLPRVPRGTATAPARCYAAWRGITQTFSTA
ncbi:MAG: 3-hydroxyacyl-CoA dehydrogenase family protein [Hymenobacter sp.]